MKRERKINCPMCGTTTFSLIFTYEFPPPGETLFPFSRDKSYHREVWQCRLCNHFISRHDMDEGVLYSGDYVNATYSSKEGLHQAFDRIVSLDPAKSDNVGRVNRVQEFAHRHFFLTNNTRRHPSSVLDVGSGLCVFLHRMKMMGWDCTALDPDPRAVKHALETVGIKAICGDFMNANDIGNFDLVTFNKVLEHVPNPTRMLAKANKNVTSKGFIYIEVPDGETAVFAGSGREEFFIDHLHIFSLTSLALLIQNAGYKTLLIERLQEPSTKYTLRAFINRNIH